MTPLMEATQSRKNKGGQYSYPWVGTAMRQIATAVQTPRMSEVDAVDGSSTGIVMRQIAPYIQTLPTSGNGTSATYGAIFGTSADTSGADIMARRMAPMIYEYTP